MPLSTVSFLFGVTSREVEETSERLEGELEADGGSWIVELLRTGAFFFDGVGSGHVHYKTFSQSHRRSHNNTAIPLVDHGRSVGILV